MQIPDKTFTKSQATTLYMNDFHDIAWTFCERESLQRDSNP